MAVGDYISEIQTSDRNTHPIGSSFWVSSETWNGKTNTEVENEIKTKFSNLTEITWSDLVDLRNKGGLIPGMQYRITDYITTTTQEDTRSAGHKFDIIVTADSESTLNKNASAIQSNSGAIYAGESNTEDLWNKDEYTYEEPLNEFEYYSTFEYNGSTYYMWKHIGDDTLAILTTERDYTTNNLQYHNNNFSLTPKIVTFLRNDEEYNASHDANLTYIVAATSDTIYVDHFYVEDSYFKNIESWELKYCLDNDETRFAWADTTNGKGVIYWMKDEYDNECPYDFKNIQFKRYAVTNVRSTKLTSNALNHLKNILVNNNNGGLYFATKNSNGHFVPSNTYGVSYEINENDYNWYYTFQGISSNDGSTINKMYDLTVETFKLTDECISYLESIESGTDTEDYCRENKIEQFNQEYFIDDIYYKGRQILNNIVFIGGLNYCYQNENSYWEYNTSSIYGNRFGVNCNSNTFGNDFRFNTFGNGCYSNTFGNNCYSNTFGNDFRFNTFGNGCQYNIFGNYCHSNTFGNDFQYNTFGNYCYWNTFGGMCYRNTIGNNFHYNTFGNGFQYNTFGHNIQNNTFGTNCQYNIFGNYCQYNTFVDNIYYNTFGNSCWHNTFGNNIEVSQFGDGVQYFSITTQQMTTKPTAANAKNYIRWLIVENGVRYVNAYVTGTTSTSSYCQNVRICLGVQGESDSNRKTFDITSCINSKVNNVYQPANSKTTSV